MSYEEYIQLLKECLATLPQTITGNQRLIEDLEMNSLTVLLFLARLEDQYHIKLPETQFGQGELTTVDALWKMIAGTRGEMAQ